MPSACPTSLLLNVGHALDHLFLLIFASAVSALGIPMLGERSPRPGFTIGWNGLAGNLGLSVLFVALLPGGAPALPPARVAEARPAV